MLVTPSIRARPYLVAAALALSSCGGSLDNKRPPSDRNAQYEHDIATLQKDVGVLSANNDLSLDKDKVDSETLRAYHDYLARLSANIDSTRPQDLPEWREMYDALTSDKARFEDNYALGTPGKPTNFFKVQQSLTNVDKVQQQHGSTIIQIQGSVSTHENRLNTIEHNITEINNTLTAKFQAVDKTLGEFSGRIGDVENRVRTNELALNDLRTTLNARIDGLELRLAAVEGLLSQHDIADIDRRLGVTEGRVEALEQTSIKLTTDMMQAQTAISTMQNDAIQLQIDTSRINSDLQILSTFTHDKLDP